MINAAMTVAEILERHPQTLDIFKQRGFGALANPFLRRTFAHLVTVGQACARHDVPVEAFLAELNEAAVRPAEPAETSGAGPAETGGGCCCGHHGVESSTGSTAGPIRAEMNVATAVSGFPETKAVFTHYFGGGCFTCPSFGREDIRLACEMHGTPLVDFLEACNRAVADARDPELASLTVNELLRRYPVAAQILNAHGLDACCGGAKRLDEAAAKHGVDLRPILAELRGELARAG